MTINQSNVTYIMCRHPSMYKTRSRPSDINMKSQIDTIATFTTPDFISADIVVDRHSKGRDSPVEEEVDWHEEDDPIAI